MTIQRDAPYRHTLNPLPRPSYEATRPTSGRRVIVASQSQYRHIIKNAGQKKNIMDDRAFQDCRKGNSTLNFLLERASLQRQKVVSNPKICCLGFDFCVSPTSTSSLERPSHILNLQRNSNGRRCKQTETGSSSRPHNKSLVNPCFDWSSLCVTSGLRRRDGRTCAKVFDEISSESVSRKELLRLPPFLGAPRSVSRPSRRSTGGGGSAIA